MVYIDKCRYEIQEEREIPAYAGPLRALTVSEMKAH
jgi:hypothetical protein